jgi:exodeoxyribonuclease X
MKLVFLDTETTGLTQYDRLCQLAFKYDDVLHDELYKPPVDINIEAMQVHKITNEAVLHKPAFKESEGYGDVKKLLEKKSTVMICHNVPYDEKMLVREGIVPATTLCTLKVARHLLKDDKKVTKYNLQYLRTHFDIQLEEARAHDALGDILVLEALFEHLVAIAQEKSNVWCEAKGLPPMKRKDIIERMIEICNAPEVALDAMPFGKYQGQKLAVCVPTDKRYFQWLYDSHKEKGDDDQNGLFATIKSLL